MKRVLFFSPYFYPYTSGLTVYSLRILKNLAKKNQVTVLTFPHKDKLQINENLEKNLKIIRIPYLFRLSKGFLSPQSFIYFFKEIKKCDALILNLPNAEGVTLALLAKIFNKKTIAIFLCQVKLGNNLLDLIIEFFLNFAVKLQLYLADKIITYPDYFESLNYGKNISKKVVHVFPPIEKKPINPKKEKYFLSIKKKSLWIGFVGRIAREKGLEYLIEAISYIKDIALELIFVGPSNKDVVGEEKYYYKIKELLEKLKIKYRFFGELNDAELGSFYETIDILALTSVNSTEAFGMVQVEAMLHGKPVIASDLPGVRMPITLTHMGLLTEPRNSTDITNAIIKIVKNKNKYSNENLIHNAVSVFNPKKTYDLYNFIVQ